MEKALPSGSIGPMTWVGLPGLEPGTSSLSGSASALGRCVLFVVMVAGLGERVAGCRRVSVPAGVGADDLLTARPSHAPAPLSPHPPHNCQLLASIHRRVECSGRR